METSKIIEILKKHSVQSAPSGSVIFNCEYETIASEISQLESSMDQSKGMTAEEWFDKNSESTCVDSTPKITKEIFLQFANSQKEITDSGCIQCKNGKCTFFNRGESNCMDILKGKCKQFYNRNI